jgi:aminopeptidase
VCVCAPPAGLGSTFEMRPYACASGTPGGNILQPCARRHNARSRLAHVPATFGHRRRLISFGRVENHSTDDTLIAMTETTTFAKGSLAQNPGFDQNLYRLAEIAVRVGLGLGRDQALVVTATLDVVPLARLISEHAYKAGASIVTTLFTDEESELLRFRCGQDASFDAAPVWLYDGIAQAFRTGAAWLNIEGNDPSLFSREDPEKVSRVNRATEKARRQALELIRRHEINWTILACATPRWASAVFPHLPQEEALARLWDAIFVASRVNHSDPITAWNEHDANLHARADSLNQKRYSAIHFRGPGTDLCVGLADNHLWLSGGRRARNGVYGIPNIPTEEIFTTPHKDRVEGRVSSTKPLSYKGTMIEEISMRFQAGKIVEAQARQGGQVLQRLIETDEGARRLGEVALVPHSSPIAVSGLLFKKALFDENAACHIALGQSFSSCVKNGDNLTPEQLASRGANNSLIHVDWMIGSNLIDIDGISSSGGSEPVMRGGEWV